MKSILLATGILTALIARTPFAFAETCRSFSHQELSDPKECAHIQGTFGNCKNNPPIPSPDEGMKYQLIQSPFNGFQLLTLNAIDKKTTYDIKKLVVNGSCNNEFITVPMGPTAMAQTRAACLSGKISVTFYGWNPQTKNYKLEIASNYEITDQDQLKVTMTTSQENRTLICETLK